MFIRAFQCTIYFVCLRLFQSVGAFDLGKSNFNLFYFSHDELNPKRNLWILNFACLTTKWASHFQRISGPPFWPHSKSTIIRPSFFGQRHTINRAMKGNCSNYYGHSRPGPTAQTLARQLYSEVSLRNCKIFSIIWYCSFRRCRWKELKLGPRWGQAKNFGNLRLALITLIQTKVDKITSEYNEMWFFSILRFSEI